MVAQTKLIAVVIPCFKVATHIANLIHRIGDEVAIIIVVDDCCPEKSGALVATTCHDPRVRVVYHQINQGVGGAVLTGYQMALEAGADVIVKIDGDGQMDPALIPAFINPILRGESDYTKGNRFFAVEALVEMPRIRLVGNIALSFVTKFSSGYWNIFDPANGYTAISARVAERLPVKKISRGYFFESDMLFRLNTMRAVVMDIPIFARYGDEQSSLSIPREFFWFLFMSMRNLAKRIGYNYFVCNVNYATLELVCGVPLLSFGIVFGSYSWSELSRQGIFASPGTVMLAALPIITGLQFLLGFMSCDMASVPCVPIQQRLCADQKTHKATSPAV